MVTLGSITKIKVQRLLLLLSRLTEAYKSHLIALHRASTPIFLFHPISAHTAAEDSSMFSKASSVNYQERLAQTNFLSSPMFRHLRKRAATAGHSKAVKMDLFRRSDVHNPEIFESQESNGGQGMSWSSDDKSSSLSKEHAMNRLAILTRLAHKQRR